MALFLVNTAMWDGRDATAVIPYASIEKNVERVANDTQDRETSRVLIEARHVWAGDTIAVRHVTPRAVVRVGDLGLDVTTSLDLVVAAEDEHGRLGLRLPNGAMVPEGWRMTVRLGRTTLRLALVADDVVALPRTLPDPRIAFGVIAAAVLHLVVLGLMSHGKEDYAESEQAARETMQRMVRAAEERAAVELAALQKEIRKTDEDAVAPAPAKESGAAGNVARSNETGRARTTRGEERHAAKPRREEVETFGLIAILTSDSGSRQGSSAFAAESGRAAMGNIFGQTIDDAAGLGGLNLSGAGEGEGAGPGGGVPLQSIGNIGTVGHPGGVGVGQGFGCGCGSARPRAVHVARAPAIVWADTTKVSGRLPPEAIQRVVRQSFGRLRLCYERGLQHSPDLEGRIAVKFVIDREGAVTMASVAERTLEDAAVASCVAKAYEAMTFPRPEGGIVTVVYPVVFTRTSP